MYWHNYKCFISFAKHQTDLFSTGYEPGGGGINVARVLQRLGAQPTAIFLGEGPAGKSIEKLMAKNGINKRKESITNATRENFYCCR